MKEIFSDSLFFGVGISIGTYIIGTAIKRRWNFFLFNPLLVAITMTIAILLVTDIDYQSYNNGAKYISYLLTPATVALAIPLYEQVDGETEYMVDSIATIAGKQFRVVRIKLRKGNMLMRKGKTAKAYEIKRIYGERS